MTRDDLEATIWKAMRAYRVTTDFPVPFVDAILAAARAYAPHGGRPPTATELALAAARRRHGQRGLTHWQKPGGPPNTAVCHGRVTKAAVTSARGDVDCGTCQESRAWRLAAAS